MSDVRRVRIIVDSMTNILSDAFDDPNGTHALVSWEEWERYRIPEGAEGCLLDVMQSKLSEAAADLERLQGGWPKLGDELLGHIEAAADDGPEVKK